MRNWRRSRAPLPFSFILTHSRKDKAMSDKVVSLGQIVITANALSVLNQTDVQTALHRHSHCDWGELCESDRRQNELALEQNLRLFSVYFDRHGIKFYVLTEHDRSVTTVLLPEDY
jgi:hypothetical protein